MTVIKKIARMVCVVPCLVVAAASCAPITTNAYLRRGAAMTSYETYGWGPTDALSVGDPRLDNNEIFDARVRAQVEAALDRRGLEQVTGLGMPDLLVHYHASVTQTIDVRVLDRGYESHQEVHDRAPLVYDAGTLMIDLVDTQTNQLVWRGWAESAIDGVIDNQAWMEQRIDKAVDRIFLRLPMRMSR